MHNFRHVCAAVWVQFLPFKATKFETDAKMYMAACLEEKSQD